MNRFDKFTHLIANISKCILKIKSVEMMDYGLKASHVKCIYYLYNNEGEGLKLKDLSELCDEDKAATSRNVKELEKTGYILAKQGGEQKYKKPLKLTELGKKIGKAIMDKINKFLELASSGIKANERNKFYEQLTSISTNLTKICKEYKGA